MKDEKLKISVIIATRNRCSLLKKALESLTRQSRPPDEVIVVDNNSTDDTRKICEDMRNVLPLTYVFEGRKGASFARNAGIRKATGDIICFIDDDCIADERWLEYMEEPFIRDPDIACVGGNLLHIDADKSLIEKLYSIKMRKRRSNLANPHTL